MSLALSAEAYGRKAHQALTSAQQLFASGDYDGAVNRAYYAMFDAAQAALRATDIPESAAATKTHRGLISAFGQHLVLTGCVATELGASLNKVERLRLLADYTGDPISTTDAAWAVEQARIFVAALRAFWLIA
jgi:uncharacterized protein (UPF0332 family)